MRAQGNSLKEYYNAAWKTYITFCRPYDSIFRLIKDKYIFAVDQLLIESADINLPADPDKCLVEHLISFYWRGLIDLEENSLLSAQNLGNIMNLITGIKNMTNQNATINGVDTQDVQTEFKANINKAIKILYKNNPQVDKDLLKLADLSEKQPATFNMLLNSLRQM